MMSLYQRRAQQWGRMNRQAKRNADIWRRREDGERLRDIGEDYGISPNRVWQIHRRESELRTGWRREQKEAA